MNAPQRTYALNRISAIATTKRAKLVEQYTVKPERVTWALAFKEFTGLKLNLNSAKLKGREDTHGLYVEDVFDLGDRVKHQYITDEGLAVLAQFDTEVQTLKDTIMLGDSEEAIKMIRDFEASA